MASLCSTWSWIIVMVAGALPFVVAAAVRAMLILVAVAVSAVVMSSWFPLLGSAILASLPSWQLVSTASVTASSPFAVVITYDNLIRITPVIL
jgi:hypothetical protein